MKFTSNKGETFLNWFDLGEIYFNQDRKIKMRYHHSTVSLSIYNTHQLQGHCPVINTFVFRHIFLFQTMIFSLLLLFVMVVGDVTARLAGAPLAACKSLKPEHGFLPSSGGEGRYTLSVQKVEDSRYEGESKKSKVYKLIMHCTTGLFHLSAGEERCTLCTKWEIQPF